MKEYIFDKDITLPEAGFKLESNTRYVAKDGITIKCQGTRVQTGLIAKGTPSAPLENIILENLPIDINAQVNFVSGIWVENVVGIETKGCKFTNSNKANAEGHWTLHNINGRNVWGWEVVDNWADGSQYKILGADFSAEDIIFKRNYAQDCTQMGFACVMQAKGSDLTIKNVLVEDNDFKNIDAHSIYVGIDHGTGIYYGTVKISDVKIKNNRMNGTAIYDDGQASKFIFVQLTTGSNGVQILDNKIVNPSSGTAIQGIHVKTVAGDKDKPHATGVVINNNEIGPKIANFGVYIERINGFELCGNTDNSIKGTIIRTSTGNVCQHSGADPRIESSNVKFTSEPEYVEDPTIEPTPVEPEEPTEPQEPEQPIEEPQEPAPEEPVEEPTEPEEPTPTEPEKKTPDEKLKEIQVLINQIVTILEE